MTNTERVRAVLGLPKQEAAKLYPEPGVPRNPARKGVGLEPWACAVCGGIPCICKPGAGGDLG